MFDFKDINNKNVIFNFNFKVKELQAEMNKLSDNNLKIKENLYNKIKMHSYIKPNQLDNFSACHHCRNIVSKSDLVKCNYRSSVNGLPVLNSML